MKNNKKSFESFEIKKYYIMHNAYKRAIQHEILHYVLSHPGRNIVDTLEEFRQKMDAFACGAKTDKSKMFFSLAYDIVTTRIDEFL